MARLEQERQASKKTALLKNIVTGMTVGIDVYLQQRTAEISAEIIKLQARNKKSDAILSDLKNNGNGSCAIAVE